MWLHVSTINGHYQANKKILFKVQKGDPTSFAVEYKILYKNIPI